MRGSAESNSALVLSLWQCKLAWFLADPTNKEANKLRGTTKTLHAMESIYKYINPLRLAIHYPHTNIPIIPEIATHFNCIVLDSGIRHEVWTGELHSLMEEIVSINQVLKDYEHRFLVDASGMNKNSTSTLRDGFAHIHQHPKFTVCLLTLWYWLLVWCFPTDNPRSINSHLKNEFILGVELDFRMLARCLADPNPHSYMDNREQQHLQHLFTVLINMMKSDLQHWIDALDYFTGKMAYTGILRGQVKEVFNAAGALKDNASMPMLSPLEMHTKGLKISAPKFLGKKGWLTKLVPDALIQKIFSEVIDNLEHVVVNLYHGLKDAVDFLAEEIPEVAEEVGHEVVHIAKQVGNGVVHFVNEVSHLGHIIAKGMNCFAEGVHSAINKVGHFFSNLF